MKVPVLTIDKPNKNGRIYPRHVVEKELAKYHKNFIAERRAIVSRKIPETAMFNLMDAMGIVTDMTIEGDTVFAEVSFFASDFTRTVAEKLIREGTYHLRTSGMGTLTKQEDGTYLVNDDWELIGCFMTDKPA